MSIPTLPLAVIGWFFAVLSFAALAIGSLLLYQLYRRGKIPPEYLQTRITNDIALLVVWLIGLASAFGMLNGLSWGRTGLEYFCWVLIVLTLLSCGSRLAATYRNAGKLPGKAWVTAVAGVILVATPVIAICGVSIYTLHSDAVMRQF
jgi:hypothetical protein